jgi:hypothetical protein
VSPIQQYESALRRVDTLLRDFGIRFHLTGGAATIAHGEPRLTLDVDLVVDRDQLTRCLPDFLAAVDREGFVHSAQTIRDAVREGRQFQLIDASDGVKLDFYPRELVPGELQRSIEFEIVPGFSIALVSRADLAIAKLIWISKGSHKSRRDLRKILIGALHSEFDTVQRAADERGLRTLLDEVLAESDEISD